ncbi:MAG: malto-oligosyltrehalose trehalohydrolase [Hyphomicrobium sp.]|jgi:malto-oligosyltrehalose trehalohydrolase
MNAPREMARWGPSLLPDGLAQFRLWAPAQKSVSLLVPEHGLALAMAASGDGWFEILTDAVRVGDGYAFRLADGYEVPDPASRAQTGDVHGPSRLVDPHSYQWRVPEWRGRPWEEAIIYEVHTGTFTAEGTFRGVLERLDYLADIGITALELMPVAQFSGRRGWGYDGVLLYAPHNAYGSPDDLRRLIDAAHEHGLMVLLDVVYNHFGPDGNHIGRYAPYFFHPERHTPWGAAIAYERAPVRDFFIGNALYWLEEFRLDGLRFDAVDQIDDQSPEPILEELAATVRQRLPHREVHLVTEDDRNLVRLHARGEDGRPKLFTAEWNDDFHHVAHVIATGEGDGYYQDYVHDPASLMARALGEGFIAQGEASHYRDGALRGEASAGLPLVAFVNFLQNHDQIGNRAFGERLTELAPANVVELMTAILLVGPQIPLLFMGEEWGSRRSFCYFTDYFGELGAAVREGRRHEFKKWPQFRDPANRDRIPDPNALSTMDASRLDWSEAHAPDRAQRLALVKRLLKLRSAEIVPRLAQARGGVSERRALGSRGFAVRWRLGDESCLVIIANFSQDVVLVSDEPFVAGRVLYESGEGFAERVAAGEIPPMSVVITLCQPGTEGL